MFIHPATGTHPGVLIWADAFGLRPALREMGKRLAAEGYAVLVPNPFYRSAKAPVLDMATFSFANPTDRAKLQPLMGAVNAPGNPEKDAVAYIAWLDAQPQVDKAKKIGTQGYCMGGPLVMRTAAAVPTRVGAGASFHGGGLVTDTPESPHLLVPKMKARMYFGVAINDDERQPDAKDKLRAALAAAKVQGEVEVYPEGAARLVHDRHAGAGGAAGDLQQGRRREGVGEAARVVQSGAGVTGRLQAPGYGPQALARGDSHRRAFSFCATLCLGNARPEYLRCDRAFTLLERFRGCRGVRCRVTWRSARPGGCRVATLLRR